MANRSDGMAKLAAGLFADDDDSLAPQNGGEQPAGRLVKISTIKRSRKQYRGKHTRAHIEQLKASFSEAGGFHGSIPVIAIAGDGNYQWEAMDGHTSLIALHELGHQEVRIEERPYSSDLDLAVQCFQFNEAGRPLSPVDAAYGVLDILCEALRAEGIASDIERAAKFIRQAANHLEGKTQSRPPSLDVIQNVWERLKLATSVSSFARNMLPLISLPGDLQTAIRDGLSVSAATVLSKVESPEIRRELAVAAIAEGWSAAELKRAIAERTGQQQEEEEEESLAPPADPFKTTYRAIGKKLKAIDRLPPERQQQVENLLKQLDNLLQ